MYRRGFEAVVNVYQNNMLQDNIRTITSKVYEREEVLYGGY